MARGPVTAGELVTELQSDTAWVSQSQQRNQELAERAARIAREEAPVLSALADVGVITASIWSLWAAAKPDEKGVAVLIEQFHLPYSSTIRDHIARALGVSQARHLAWDFVVAEIRKGHPSEVTQGLFAALAGTAKRDDASLLVEMLSDERLAPERAMLIPKLMQSRQPAVRSALIEIADAPDLRDELGARLRRARRA